MAFTHILQLTGRDLGFRFPETLLRAIGLHENDHIEISCQDDTITIRKAPFSHRSLEERLTAFYGKPIDKIEPVSQREEDWGPAKGDEI